jgi:hypothetical protein
MAISRSIIMQASRQGGYVRRSELLEQGLSESAVGRLVARGDITPVVSGVYRVIPSEAHVDLIRGAVLALPAATVSHQSAAHLLEFPLVPRLVATVTVHSQTTHRFPGVTVRRSADLAPEHLTRVDGLAVTNTVRTVFDLASILSFDEFDEIVESLVISGRMRLRSLELMVNSLARRGKPGVARARESISSRGKPQDVDPTILERKGRAVLVAHRVDLPTPQFPIPWDKRRRFDDAFPEAKVALEWDSREWHSHKRAMQNDRQRDRLAAVHGWVVLRFTWDDVTNRPAEVADTVRTVLARRGV